MKANKIKTLILTTAVITVAALAGNALWQPQKTSQNSAMLAKHKQQQQQKATRLSSHLKAASSADFSWRDGRAQRYQLSMQSSMALNSDHTHMNQVMQIVLQAELQLQTLRAKGMEALAGLRLDKLQLTIAGQTDPDMNAALQKPFRVEFSSLGKPVSFAFPAGLTSQEQDMLRNIITTFTVSMTEAGKQQQWLVREQNASGAYQANYRQKQLGQFTKAKANFIAAETSPMLAGGIIQSQEKFTIDSHTNWLTSMQVEESLNSQPNRDPTININSRARLTLLHGNIALNKTDWDFIAAKAMAKTSQQGLSIATYNLSPEQARAKLQATVGELDQKQQGRTPSIHLLRDLLRLDDSVPAVLLEQLQTRELSERTRADLYLALELAETPASQAALTQVMTEEGWSNRDALRATVALAGINHPSPQTLDALWQTTSHDNQQLAATASYSLGSMGSRMQANNNPDYPALRSELLQQAYSGSPQKRSTYIYALGNTRDTEITGEIAGFLDDEQAIVRRAAALSLGLMQSQQSSNALATRLQNENSSEVRGAMAESLSRLPIKETDSIMATMNHLIKKENNEKTRFAIARFMGKNITQHPEYRVTLKKLARDEPSKRVRQLINEALANKY